VPASMRMLICLSSIAPKIESTVRYLGTEVDDAIEIEDRHRIAGLPPRADLVGDCQGGADYGRADDRFWDVAAVAMPS
jgi:hypothetical protein